MKSISFINMNESYKESYNRLLTKVAEYFPDKHGSITSSWVLSGNNYESGEGLMVIGRAPMGTINSKIVKWLPSEANCTKKKKEIISLIREEAENRVKCPMSWVVRFGNDSSACNTNRSGFWRVSRKIVLGDDNFKGDIDCWPSYIAWSSLYKVVLAEGGNPLASLKKIQFEECVKLLATELELLNPKRVLVMAGESWYQPFVEQLNVKITHSSSGFVERVGHYRNQKWVFTQNPQSRRENFIESIKEAFAN